MVVFWARLGHMPNGNRVYYEKRSQPPFLALMVEAYIEHPSVSATDGKDLIALVLPSLEREYSFWMTSRTETFWHNEAEQTLNVYKGGLTHPRPESYREDFTLAENLTGAAKEGLYANLGAGAESGWDFSSRWLDSAQAQFSTIRTQQIVPVDLNAVLCAQERLMADFYNVTGQFATLHGHILISNYTIFPQGTWKKP
jgi:alpha,alpha-trehalase